MTKECPFCELPPERIIDSNEFGFVIRDGFPISPGHTLIIPKRHLGSFFEITLVERDALLTSLDKAKETIDTEFHPDGFNIDINDGPSAGQTAPHLHKRPIQKDKNDQVNSRGGVRRSFNGKASLNK